MPQFRKRYLVFLALIILAPVALQSLGSFLDPLRMDTSLCRLSPCLSHPFGTDSFGRDMLARVIFACGLSLKVVMQSVFVSLILAGIFGSLAGYFQNSFLDRAICWLISLIYTVPFILIVLALCATIQPGLEGVFLIIGCIGSSAPTKLVRSEIIQQRAAPFVTALGAFGFSNSYIMFKALLPICILPAIFSLLYAIPELIGIEVGLSFFGLGAQPPIPSLGRLIYDGLSEFYSAWWLTLIPAGVLFVLTSTIYCFAPSAEVRQ